MRDEWFIRGKVPMTKSEVRAVSVSKLELTQDSVLYDIGAGTGSVSIEAALQIPRGQIFAVEQNREAVDLIRQNKEKFHADNVRILWGKAPEILEGLPVPSHVFLGGTGGKPEEIIAELLRRNPGVRIVANVIALESLARFLEAAKNLGLEPEVVSVQVARAEQAGEYHLMKGQNPVYIISMGGAGDRI